MTGPILAVLALWVVQTLLPSSIFSMTVDKATRDRFYADHLRGHDNVPPLPLYAARALRAQHNMMEALPVFLGLSMLLLVREATSGTAIAGAWVFFAARLLYVPAYIVAVPGLRSAVWGASWVGLGMMIWQLV